MPEEKLEIARALDAAGIDRIEAGFPRVSDDDWRAVELIAGAGLRAEVWGFSRAVQADVEALVELGVTASVIESPISDGEARRRSASRATRCSSGSARRSRSPPGTASRSRSSASTRSRADLEFFRRAYEAAVEAGAKEVVVVDTIGIATPEAAALLVGEAVDLARPRDPRALARARRLRARAPPPRWRPCRPAPPGCRGRSTAWASGPATPT